MMVASCGAVRAWRKTWATWVSVGWMIFAGCGQQDAVDGPVVLVTSEGSSEHGEVELSDPVTRLEGNVVHVEVKYRFTKGKPLHQYLLEIRFPGTNNSVFKPMDGWELQPRGGIRDGFYIEEFPISDYEIEMKEAFTDQDGYDSISNILTGTVEGVDPPASEDSSEDSIEDSSGE